MSVSKIANRYAKSLIDLGNSNGVLEKVMGDVKGFIKLSENKEFSVFLKSPIISSDKKINVFEELLSSRVQNESLLFFKLVIKKGRENILPEIMTSVLRKYKAVKGITTVTLTSATELSQNEFNNISGKLRTSNLASENVEYIKKIDPSIIGGFVIEIDDKLYDASIAGKLKRIKKELI